MLRRCYEKMNDFLHRGAGARRLRARARIRNIGGHAYYVGPVAHGRGAAHLSRGESLLERDLGLPRRCWAIQSFVVAPSEARAALEPFAASLGRDDRVALEVSGNAWEVARSIGPHVARVAVVSPADTGIRSARARTDRLDARALARLLASGSLDAVWVPDDETRAIRRRLQRRSRLVRVKTKAKNEIHAALMRRPIAKPRFSDLFGLEGRRWLAELELPAEERQTVDGCMRQLDFRVADGRGGGEREGALVLPRPRSIQITFDRYASDARQRGGGCRATRRLPARATQARRGGRAEGDGRSQSLSRPPQLHVGSTSVLQLDLDLVDGGAAGPAGGRGLDLGLSVVLPVEPLCELLALL
jgi:hypothetical protein